MYIPASARAAVNDPTATLALTEGAKKALAATAAGVPCVSIQGVWNWCQPRQKKNGKKFGPFKLIPDLAGMEWKGRRVHIIYDSDAATKSGVKHGEKKLAEVLGRHGAEVHVVRLPDEPDGSKNGLDDFLVRYGADKLRELLKPSAAETRRDFGEATLSNPAELVRLAQLKLDDPAAYGAFKATFRKRGGSVRDLETAIGPRVTELLRERHEASRDTGDTPQPYSIRGGILTHTTLTKDGPVDVPLGNFAATIVEETVRDDGAERHFAFSIEGQTATGNLERTEVLAEDFPYMAWPTQAWGNKAIVYAGQGTKDKFRVGVQVLSGTPPRRTIFTHCGWREVDGQWVYLHGNGAIGPDGNTEGVTVDLSGPLAKFRLPPPPTGRDLVAAVRAVLSIIAKDKPLAADRIILPLLGLVFRAVVGGTLDFGLHVEGRTGTFKSELAALAQQFFGAGLDSRNLPANWSSTSNALEATAFAAKDAVLVVDDFAPNAAVDPQKLHAAADRLFRGSGNGAARTRLNADLTVRPDRPARSLIMSTGEDSPKGHSIRARVPIIEIEPGSIDVAALTRCQEHAAEGQYAATTAGFIRWLAPTYAETLRGLPAARAAARDTFRTSAPHARTPQALGDLFLGWDRFTQFAVASKVITASDREAILARVRAALIELAEAQAEHLRAADPADQFLNLVPSILLAGHAHLDTKPPHIEPHESNRAMGWVLRATGDWDKKGPCIGWVDANHLYLLPDATYAVVQQMATQQRNPITMTQRTLWARLRERGVLLEGENRGGKSRATVRLTVAAQRVDVLKFSRSLLSGGSGSVPSVPDLSNPWKSKAMKRDTAEKECPNWDTPEPPECPTTPTPSAGKPRPAEQPERVGHSECPTGALFTSEWPAAKSETDSSSGRLGHSGHSAHPKREAGEKRNTHTEEGEV
ncbi:MAG: DUF3854 domain-containing protein [Gemmataceae bacterium]